tara:strand:+ start:144435 stop:145178 length:744 start_codon:yes stop_codon:yes gene_type:complete
MSAKIIQFKPVAKKGKKRDEFIISYMPIVEIIAKKIIKTLPASFELDDLVSCGVIGLMDAIDKFDSSKGVRFKTYAEYRIRGQIIDDLRSQDWASRNIRDKMKSLEKTQKELSEKLGRKATAKEMSSELGIDIKSYFRLENNVVNVKVVSIDDANNCSNKLELKDMSMGANPSELIQEKNLRTFVESTVHTLPEREGKLLWMYYYDNKTMKEISQELRLTESRVSQLHGHGVKKLKEKVENSELFAA